MVSPARITAMRDAIVEGDVKKVRLLLKSGVPAASGERIPFVCLAASLSRTEIFELLVENGASLDSEELLEYAVDGGGGRIMPSVAIVEKLLASRDYPSEILNRSLRFACVSGSPEVVRKLVEKGADPNAFDQTQMDFPLSNAVLHGRIAVVAELLNLGANPNVEVFEENELSEKTGNKITLVDLAIQHGFPEIAKLLG